MAGYYYYQTQQNKSLILYGNVDIRTVNLSFRVGGKLQTLNVDEGDKISAGQILASLDKTPYQNSLQRATGILNRAKAKLDMLGSGYRSQEIAQVEAEVTQHQVAWKYGNSFYQRQQGLRTQRIISANELENVKNNRNQTLAALNTAKDKLNQYQTGYRTEEISHRSR